MLQQLVMLMAFQAIGEAVVKVIGVPFPGPLCGMLLLLVYLQVVGGPSEQLAAVGSTLVDHLGLLFVPAGTAIITYGALLVHEGLTILAALFLSTIIAVLAAGMIAQRLARRSLESP